MISTRNLQALPDIKILRKLCQSLALLDAIIMPEWEWRYYSYNAMWDTNEEMASMRDGSGNHYFILFTKAGAIIKGYNKDSEKSDPAIFEEIPKIFEQFLTEPAFIIGETTFCIWRQYSDPCWKCSSKAKNQQEDNSDRLLYILEGNPRTYQTWAEGYYERKLDLHAITNVYHHKPLTQQMITLLNPEVTIEQIKNDLFEIGYPH